MIQCKELIRQHEYTFNYQRLAELHVSWLNKGDIAVTCSTGPVLPNR